MILCKERNTCNHNYALRIAKQWDSKVSSLFAFQVNLSQHFQPTRGQEPSNAVHDIYIFTICKRYVVSQTNRDSSFQEIFWFQEILQEISWFLEFLPVQKSKEAHIFRTFLSISGNFDPSGWRLWLSEILKQIWGWVTFTLLFTWLSQ